MFLDTLYYQLIAGIFKGKFEDFSVHNFFWCTKKRKNLDLRHGVPCFPVLLDLMMPLRST